MRVPLSGSESKATLDARDLGPVDPAAEAEVTVVLCSQMSDRELDHALQASSTKPVSERKYLTREELARLRGAKAEDIQRVKSFAQEYHLTITQVDPASRTVKLRGTLADLQTAFGVELRKYEKEGTQFRSHRMPITLPDTLAGAVQAVLGLDDHPIAKPKQTIQAIGRKSR